MCVCVYNNADYDGRTAAWLEQRKLQVSREGRLLQVIVKQLHRFCARLAPLQQGKCLGVTHHVQHHNLPGQRNAARSGGLVTWPALAKHQGAGVREFAAEVTPRIG